MAKDYKYEDSTPVDEPVRKGSKVQEPGSGIRVDGKPVNKLVEPVNKLSNKHRDLTAVFDAIEADYKDRGEKASDRASRTNVMGDTYAKGGMTASKRADGIAQRGKTKGTIVMCGGGMSK